MPSYVMHFRFTEKGIENVKESPARVGAAKETVQALGGQVTSFFAVLGADFDTMFVVEAPDDDAAARMALSISARGFVRTSTHRAFSHQEFEGIASGLR